MKREIFKHIKKFLPLIGIILLVYLIYSLGLEDIKNAFLSIHPIFIILSLSLTVPRIFIRNYSWQIILKEQKINISYWNSLKIFLIGFFYCSMTPGFVGHVIRIPYMKEYTNEPYGKLFINTLIEVLVRTYALYTIIIIGLIVLIQQTKLIFNLVLLWIFVIIIPIIIVIYFLEKHRGEKTFLILIKYFIPKSFKQDLKTFVTTFYKDFPRFRKLIIPYIIGGFTWILIFFQEYFIVIALNLDIPFFDFLCFISIANVIGFVPITVAGMGTRDATAVFIFTTLYPVTGAEILVVSLLGFILTDVFTGLIGFFVTLNEEKKSFNLFFNK